MFGNFHRTSLDNTSIECNPTSPMEDWPSCKRWQVDTPYSPLLRVRIRNTFTDSMKFPLHYMSILHCKCPLIPLPSFHNPSSLLKTSLSSHSPSEKWVLLLLHREIHDYTLGLSSLPNFSRSTDCKLLIIYLIPNMYL